MATTDSNVPARIISNNNRRRGFQEIPSNDDDDVHNETPSIPQPETNSTNSNNAPRIILLPLSSPNTTDHTTNGNSEQQNYQTIQSQQAPGTTELESEVRRRRLIMTCLLPFSLILLFSDNDGSVGDDLWTIIFFLAMMNIICAFLESSSQQTEESGADQHPLPQGMVTSGGTFSEEASSMTYMSFQAQLAAAILESRRVQVLELLGRGDETRPTVETVGVSEENKMKWDRFVVEGEATKRKMKGDEDDLEIGNVDEDIFKGADSEDMTCSICLCEYEGGEDAIRLPCDHIYHDECISSWTKNHTRCPLCNLNLGNESERIEIT